MWNSGGSSDSDSPRTGCLVAAGFGNADFVAALEADVAATAISVARCRHSLVLYGSEQENLALYRKFMEPMDALHEKGIVGPDLPD